MKSAAVATCLVAGLLATPASGAGCAGVRRAGGWAVADEPFTMVGDTGSTVHQTTRLPSYPVPLAAAGGVPGRWFSSDGVSVFRSADGGCSWQRTYTLDPAALTAASPDAIAPSAEVQYKIAGLATPLPAPGVKPSADVVYALLSYGDGLAGIGFAAAGLTPYFVARSADGGKTWRTDLLAAPLAAGAPATPVLGDGHDRARIALSPADPRTVYVSVLTPRDPRALPTERTDIGGVYVSRDAGATWSFGAPQVVGVAPAPDARDPLTYYGTDGLAVDAVTLGASPARHRLLTLSSDVNERVVAIDTTREPGRPARLLLTTRRTDGSGLQSVYRLFRSLDGGKTWTKSDVPGTAVGDLVYLGAWLTPAGDAETLRCIGGFLARSTVLQRWTATRRWLPGRIQPVPRGVWAKSTQLVGFDVADSGHRLLAVRALEEAQNANRYVVGVVDLRSS